MEISFNHKHEVYRISVVGVFKKLEKSKRQLPILPFKIIHFYIGFFATCITRSRRKKRNARDMVKQEIKMQAFVTARIRVTVNACNKFGVVLHKNWVLSPSFHSFNYYYHHLQVSCNNSCFTKLVDCTRNVIIYYLFPLVNINETPRTLMLIKCVMKY